MLPALLLPTALAGAPEPLAVEVVDPAEVRAIEQVRRPINAVSGRTELGGGLDRVSAPFLRRHALSVHAAQHVSESFAVRLVGTFVPDFGQSDWNHVHFGVLNGVNSIWLGPSSLFKVLFAGDVLFEFAPVQGAVTSGSRVWDLDAVVLAGTGMAYARDDLVPAQCNGVTTCTADPEPLPATLTLGGGVRLHRKRAMLRLEVRSSWFAVVHDQVEVDLERRTWVGLRAGALVGR